MKCHSFIW